MSHVTIIAAINSEFFKFFYNKILRFFSYFTGFLSTAAERRKLANESSLIQNRFRVVTTYHPYFKQKKYGHLETSLRYFQCEHVCFRLPFVQSGLSLWHEFVPIFEHVCLAL